MRGDDHLKTRKTNAGIGQLAEVEGPLRVCHVHHDLERGRRHVAQIGGGALERQQAIVDEAGVAFGATDRHFLAVAEHVGGIARAHHRRHAELTRDDRCMAGAAAAVGDDGRGALHHRLPIGVGHVRDQHIASLDAIHVVQRAHHACHAATDLGTDGAAFGQDLGALGFQRKPFDLGRMTARLHRLRTRLHDEQLAADPVLGPLDVHRAAVMLFDHQCLLGQFLHVFVADRKGAAQFHRRVFGAHPFAGHIRIDHANGLAAERAAQDRRLACSERGLVDIELVRVDRALHDHFAQAEARCDEHHVAETGFGVQREQHACRAYARAHHQLHAGRQEHVFMLEAVMHAIGNRTIVVEAGEHFLDLVHHIVGAGHIEEGLLLACERGVRKVLGGCRGAHGHGNVAAAVLGAQLGVGAADVAVQVRLQWGIDHPAADFLAGQRECIDVFDIQRCQPVEDALGQIVVRDEVLESFRGGRISTRNRDAQPSQVADHLAKRGIFTAHAGQVGQA